MISQEIAIFWKALCQFKVHHKNLHFTRMNVFLKNKQTNSNKCNIFWEISAQVFYLWEEFSSEKWRKLKIKMPISAVPRESKKSHTWFFYNASWINLTLIIHLIVQIIHFLCTKTRCAPETQSICYLLHTSQWGTVL